MQRIDFRNAQKNHCIIRRKGKACISREQIKDKERKMFFETTAIELVISVK